MEREIGEVFEYQGKKLRVEKDKGHTCNCCFFRWDCDASIVNPVAGDCINREDGENVVFVEVSEEHEEQTAPEELNLLEKLKYCPEGTPFWSPMLGDVKFWCVSESLVTVEDKVGNSWDINSDSTLTIGGIGGVTSEEPMLYPSREQRDWGKWKCPKPKFDPKTLQPFDRVLVRGQVGLWSPALFTYLCDVPPRKEQMMDNLVAKYVIPYNDDTKHLVGTSDKEPEFYRYWED